MRTTLLVMLAGIVAVAAKEEVAKLTPAELAHQRHFWSIGEGFEGTASDWTEYVVWLVGVIGVFYYMANPNARRNLHAIEDDEVTTYKDDPGDDPVFSGDKKDD
jgi:hypothetical protein